MHRQMMPVDRERAALDADLAHREALLDLFYLSQTSCARKSGNTLGYLEVAVFQWNCLGNHGIRGRGYSRGVWLVCDG